MKELNQQEEKSPCKAGWVTFDDGDPASNYEMNRETSPIVEIGYEDLFKAVPHDTYVIVSPERKQQNIDSGSSSKESDSSFASLLDDTLSSMSLETRSLLTKPTDANESNQTSIDPTNPTNPFHSELQNPEKKKRRPPPRPPPPSVQHGSIKKPTNVAPPPRNIPSVPRPSVPRPPVVSKHPTLTSTTFKELSCNTDTKTQANANKMNQCNDPFADLLTETRNGIAQNLNKS